MGNSSPRYDIIGSLSYGAIASVLIVVLYVFASLPAPLYAQGIPEKLTYNLAWTGIPVGTATQEIFDDGEMHMISSTARSNDWLSVFFPVEDKIESSLIKSKSQFPGVTCHYRMQMREGKYHRDREIFFDQEKGIAHYVDNLTGEKKDIPITENTFDIYACFYHIRHQKLEVGKPLTVKVLDGKEPQNIVIQVLRKERIWTIFGNVDTIVIRPLVKPVGVFEGKGSVHIWLTDDARRIPVKAQTKVRVGSVTATLVGISH